MKVSLKPKPTTLHDISPDTHIIAAIIDGKPCLLQRRQHAIREIRAPWYFRTLTKTSIASAGGYGGSMNVQCWRDLVRELLDHLTEVHAFTSDRDFFQWLASL